jgi:apolipoprotein D and lipocalin family protein
MRFVELCLAASVFAAPASIAPTPLCTDATAPCDKVDLSKYLGTWYEIGNTFPIYTFIQRNLQCVRAQYSLNEDGNINVRNSGVNSETNAYSFLDGVASIVNNNELIVGFPGAGAPPPTSTNYVIKNIWVDCEGNYSRVLVVSPKDESLPAIREFTWILSRTPQITQQEVEESLAYAKAAGYNPEQARFKLTEQVSCAGFIPTEQ